MSKALILTAMVSVAALTGCAKPWGLVHDGMKMEEVHRYLGNPDFHGKTEECWRDRIVSDSSPERGDYCVYFLDGVVQEYGWTSVYRPHHHH